MFPLFCYVSYCLSIGFLCFYGFSYSCFRLSRYVFNYSFYCFFFCFFVFSHASFKYFDSVLLLVYFLNCILMFWVFSSICVYGILFGFVWLYPCYSYCSALFCLVVSWRWLLVLAWFFHWFLCGGGFFFVVCGVGLFFLIVDDSGFVLSLFYLWFGRGLVICFAWICVPVWFRSSFL